MGYQSTQRSLPGLWALVARQHGVITRRQLLGLGYSPQSIQHRLARGRLHRVRRGVYSLGRPDLTSEGRWIAAVLSCGPQAALSHASAAALWGLGSQAASEIEISLPAPRDSRQPGVVVHRRTILTAGDLTTRRRIPVTTPICTLIDLAPRLPRRQLEAAVSEADKLGLTDPEALRAALDELGGRPGAKALRETLDRRSFRLTDSELERRFLPLADRAGLARPETQRIVNGFRVDFYWPEIGLVVETDGLRYHRTASQQTRDRLRDQAHAIAGHTCLRFTHAQVASRPGQVTATLAAVAGRLSG